MNRINPSYIALLLLGILFIILYQNHSIQQSIAQQQERLYKLRDVAKEIGTLKNYWGDAKTQKKRIARLLETPFIKKFVTKKEKRGDRYRITLDNIDAASADRIADKIFNSFVKIGTLKIVKKDKTKLSMEVEFRF